MSEGKNGNLLVGAGVSMQGTITVQGEAIVDGNIQGRITADFLHVTTNGAINGVSTASNVLIAGKVNNTTVAHKTLVIESTGIATGNIAYADLEIKRGGDIQGNITIINRPAKPAA